MFSALSEKVDGLLGDKLRILSAIEDSPSLVVRLHRLELESRQYRHGELMLQELVFENNQPPSKVFGSRSIRSISLRTLCWY